MCIIAIHIILANKFRNIHLGNAYTRFLKIDNFIYIFKYFIQLTIILSNV